MSNPNPYIDEAKSLLTIISNPGRTDAMARFALQHGALSAYHSYGHGTVPSHLLSLLGLAGVRREMVTLTVPKAQGSRLLDSLCEQFHLGKETNGIAFIQSFDDKEDIESSEYFLIAAVVNEGAGEDVVDSARKSHPVGATILKALGTANHSKKTFNFEINPQKELVLIIARSCHVDALCHSICDGLQKEEPGHGILFAFALDEVRGILDMVPKRDRDTTEKTLHSRAVTDDHVALLVALDRGHSHDIVSVSESHGGAGATILHFRRTEPYSQGWYGRLGDLEKEVILIIAKRQVTEAIRGALSDIKGKDERELAFGQLKVSRFCRLSGAL